MNGYINKNQINYIFYHLSLYIEKDVFQLIKPRLNFFEYYWQNNVDYSDIKGKIIFNLSSLGIKIDKIFFIDEIPILFPINKKDKMYSIENRNLVFHHDILKSAFYLLSGYQEYNSDKQDKLGRFPYSESIQHKLGIIHKPVVNYYFEIILNGIEEFCKTNAIPFHRKTLFDGWKVMLTHDVDRIKTYSLNEVAYKAKQFLGISPSQHSKIHQYRLLVKYATGFLTQRWNNPHWDFNIFREWEEEYGYKSVFFFLPKELPHHDASYKLSEARIKHLLQKLDQEDCEIGLHGPVRSFYDNRSMSKAYNDLSRYSPQTPLGIRQHRLLYMHPETLKIQKEAGLKYDTTLGFAAHEGFRNSYCLPFKTYDFENDRIIDFWEIPLIAMDATLFNYRKLDAEEAENIFDMLIGEIKKFNGIFTILWHNGFGTDHPDKKIPWFYQRALTLFFRQKAFSILGNKVIKRLENI